MNICRKEWRYFCLGCVHFISYFKLLGEILRPYVYIKSWSLFFPCISRIRSMYLQSTCLVTLTICCPIFGSNMQYIQMLTVIHKMPACTRTNCIVSQWWIFRDKVAHIRDLIENNIRRFYANVVTVYKLAIWARSIL